MKIKKQRVQLPVRQFEYRGGALKKKHSALLPNNIRALFCGPSNCGKTNLLLSMLVDKNGVKFQNVYLFSKSFDQQKYAFLEQAIKRVKGVNLFTFSDRVLKADEVEKNSVCIFDDITSEKQSPIQDFFSMGRHKSLDCFFLCQTYSRISKQLVRDNANIIVLFKMDEMNLKHVFNDHVACDMNYSNFHEICRNCWENPYGFLLINKESERSNGRYRKGVDVYINPE